MMKKRVFILLMFTVLLSLTGCGNKNEVPEKQQSEQVDKVEASTVSDSSSNLTNDLLYREYSMGEHFNAGEIMISKELLLSLFEEPKQVVIYCNDKIVQTINYNNEDIRYELTSDGIYGFLLVDETGESLDITAHVQGTSYLDGETDDILMLDSCFERNGYDVMIETGEPEILRGERYILKLSGESEACVTVYQYDNVAQAQEEVSCIDKSGDTITLPDQTNYVTWKSVPHYFYQDKAIIQYVGTDDTILMLLTELYGEPFAGGAN